MGKIFTYLMMFLATLFGAILPQATSAQIGSFEQGEMRTTGKKMNIYPVPATTIVTIELPSGLREVTDRIEIFDISGKRVLEQKKYNKQASEMTFSNLSELAAGVYIITAVDKDGRMLQSSRMIIGNR